MNYNELGFNIGIENYRRENNLDSFNVGRVILEHKERYVVKTPDKEYNSELIGNLRYTADSIYDFPAVGDWVAFSEYDEGKALIHAIYPRTSLIERQAVGKHSQAQIIATNVDYALIVQAVDRDFNINRLERYLTICNASKVEPIIVLSKIDLLNNAELESIIDQLKQRIHAYPIISVSSVVDKGYEKVNTLIQQGKTYCLLGSSGVGKSTLLNSLAGTNVMKTRQISTSVNKGKHTTSHRELVIMENGGIIIDNPGMREVGISDSSSGLEITFDTIIEYAENCKYKDCTHDFEDGCAVLEAIQNGKIDNDSYLNFQKIQREREHYESSTLEKKQKDKDFGKMVKQVKKQRKNNKF